MFIASLLVYLSEEPPERCFCEHARSAKHPRSQTCPQLGAAQSDRSPVSADHLSSSAEASGRLKEGVAQRGLQIRTDTRAESVLSMCWTPFTLDISRQEEKLKALRSSQSGRNTARGGWANGLIILDVVRMQFLIYRFLPFMSFNAVHVSSSCESLGANASAFR